MKPPLYLAVYVPEFPAQALLRLRPDLQRQPVAVLRGTPPLQQVCSVNSAARAMDVQIGMTRSQLDAFDGLHTLPASGVEEASATNALLEAAAVFTPRIEVQPQQRAAFAMVLDLTGTTLMWGIPHVALQRIASAMQELQFTARLVASSNVAASLCLAAVPQRKPMLIQPGDEARAVACLPLSALQLSPEQAETMTLWGLNTVGEFAALPVVDVVTRLGQQGKRLHEMASGTRAHLFRPQEPVFLLEEKIELDSPVEVLDSLLFVLGPMLDQLVRRAMNRAYALADVTVELGLEGGALHARTVRPSLPTSERTVLLKLLQLDLQAHPPAAGIVAVCMSAITGDRGKVQSGLFAPQLPESMSLDVTLARIAALVGEGYAGKAQLQDTHAPDAFTMQRFRVAAEGRTATRSNTSGCRAAAVTAVRRYRPPLPLTVYTQHKHHAPRPLSFYMEGKLYLVKEVYGPWRRSGDWWSANVWSYEEWDVRSQPEDRAGEHHMFACVLGHDLLRNTWTLEAAYD